MMQDPLFHRWDWKLFGDAAYPAYPGMVMSPQLVRALVMLNASRVSNSYRGGPSRQDATIYVARIEAPSSAANLSWLLQVTKDKAVSAWWGTSTDSEIPALDGYGFVLIPDGVWNPPAGPGRVMACSASPDALMFDDAAIASYYIPTRFYRLIDAMEVQNTFAITPSTVIMAPNLWLPSDYVAPEP